MGDGIRCGYSSTKSEKGRKAYIGALPRIRSIKYEMSWNEKKLMPIGKMILGGGKAKPLKLSNVTTRKSRYLNVPSETRLSMTPASRNSRFAVRSCASATSHVAAIWATGRTTNPTPHHPQKTTG